MNEAGGGQAVRNRMLVSSSRGQSRMGDQMMALNIIGAVQHVRLKAPKVSWYLVAETLAPLGKTCWLGIE
jgi:hypothetical protein